MNANRVSPALRERLGHEATMGLAALLNDEEQLWRDRVLTIAAERFEHGLAMMSERFDRRLAEELARSDRRLVEELAGLRVALVTEIHEKHSDTLRWAFLFWIGQFAAFVGLFALLQRALVR